MAEYTSPIKLSECVYNLVGLAADLVALDYMARLRKPLDQLQKRFEVFRERAGALAECISAPTYSEFAVLFDQISEGVRTGKYELIPQAAGSALGLLMTKVPDEIQKYGLPRPGGGGRRR